MTLPFTDCMRREALQAEGFSGPEKWIKPARVARENYL
jgi:hypothetical protein